MLAASVRVRSFTNQGLVLVALVLGLVLGATAVGLVWFVSGKSASATELPNTDASTDAVAACATLARVPPLTSAAFTVQSPQGVPSGIYRLTGAASLAEAAKAEDSYYQPLSDALAKVAQVLETFDSAAPQATQAMNAARAACAAL